ncbi:hypothetical protein SAMN06297280_0792 [Arsukibacterium tuosuense]|uniref:Uncharacterized protein n=1 Tax=Arsukibacterium tuosuense TaxID=1323745 RepID=A0A285ID08_9GAMM|nr:hypothetical protein [Arsukibacterium tuosuense]SNY44821.1 hypothetical protein SAMN06297280_0792 [Arsukibacterium tuosuense]
MKNCLILILVLFVISFSAFSKEVLYEIPTSGIKISATKNVKKVDGAGTNVQFFLEDRNIFSTAFVHKDTRNPYPLLEDFAELFYRKMYARVEHQVVNSQKVVGEFSNINIAGVEYLIESENSKCELFVAYAIGNQTYVMFNYSDEVSENSDCKNTSDKLKNAAWGVTSSIFITEI